jgi:hypothetical protein
VQVDEAKRNLELSRKIIKVKLEYRAVDEDVKYARVLLRSVGWSQW